MVSHERMGEAGGWRRSILCCAWSLPGRACAHGGDARDRGGGGGGGRECVVLLVGGRRKRGGGLGMVSLHPSSSIGLSCVAWELCGAPSTRVSPLRVCPATSPAVYSLSLPTHSRKGECPVWVTPALLLLVSFLGNATRLVVFARWTSE